MLVEIVEGRGGGGLAGRGLPGLTQHALGGVPLQPAVTLPGTEQKCFLSKVRSLFIRSVRSLAGLGMFCPAEASGGFRRQTCKNSGRYPAPRPGFSSAGFSSPRLKPDNHIHD